MLWVLFCAVPVLAEDNYVHTFTGFNFPPKVAAFTRVQITPFNEAKSDIGVDYNNDPFTVHLSIYVYPSSGMYTAGNVPLKQHYEDCKASVIKAHPPAKLLEETPVTFAKSGADYDGLKALYSFHDKFINHQDQDLLSQLILFQRGDYYVLFRITYAQSDKTAAEQQIADFLKQLAWPAGDKNPSST